MPASPTIQHPQTPQYYGQPQQFPQPSIQQPQQHQQQQQQTSLSMQSDMANAANQRRNVSRNLQYKDTAYETRRHSQSMGLTVDSFRLLSVLGRGHFGKVILSQYKNTG